MPVNGKLRVFLCHASQDKPVVRELYQRLRSEDWIDPWLDEEKILPGQEWDMEIEKSVEAADVVIVCLSNTSVSKEGYIQRELRFVLDIALEKPEGAIFIIPLRLDECELPRRIRTWQYVNYFPSDQREVAYQKLLQSLRIRSRDAKMEFAAKQVETSENLKSNKDTSRTSAEFAMQANMPGTNISEARESPGILEVGGTISLIVYFLLTSFDLFASTGDTLNYLVAASALAGGVFLLYKRSLPGLSVFKYSMAVYLLGYGVNDYFFSDENQLLSIVTTLSALVCSGLLAMTFRSLKKNANYSAIFLFVFLLFYGGSSLLNVYGDVPPAFLGLVISVITFILLLMDL